MKNVKLSKILSTCGIIGLFISVGVLALMATGVFGASRFVIDLLLIVAILSFGCVSCITATKILDTNKKGLWAICAYVLLGLTALTCLLWIIFVFVGQNFIFSVFADSASEESFVSIWNFAKFVIVLTIQTSIINLVVTNVTILKSKMIPFQVILYLSNFIVDLYITLTVIGIKFAVGEEPALTINMFKNRALIAIFTLALAYSFTSAFVLRRMVRRNNRERVSEIMDRVYEEKVQSPTTKMEEVSLSDRIKRLDDLKAQGLINDEEYKERKAKLLEEI